MPRKATGSVVLSMDARAIRDPQIRQVAETLSKIAGSEGTLSEPQLAQLRDSLESGPRAGIPALTHGLEAYRDGFERIESAFSDKSSLLELVERPTLLYGQKRLDHIFEVLPETELPLDKLVGATEDTGLDRIIVETKDGRRFMAVHKGWLHGLSEGEELDLDLGDRHEKVTVTFVHDVANTFLEGLMRFPRKIRTLFTHLMDHATYEDGHEGGQTTRAIAALGTIAGIIGGGATLIANAPMIAVAAVALAAGAVTLNAISGMLRNHGYFSDPHKILNAAGIRMRERIDLD